MNRIWVALGFFCLAGLMVWLMWGPVASFFIGIIPADAAYAWAGKLVVYVIGGIAIPLFFVVVGIVAILTSTGQSCVAADVGKRVEVKGAAAAGATLFRSWTVTRRIHSNGD